MINLFFFFLNSIFVESDRNGFGFHFIKQWAHKHSNCAFEVFDWIGTKLMISQRFLRDCLRDSGFSINRPISLFSFDLFLLRLSGCFLGPLPNVKNKHNWPNFHIIKLGISMFDTVYRKSPTIQICQWFYTQINGARIWSQDQKNVLAGSC